MLKGCMVRVRLGTRDLDFVQMNHDFAFLQVPTSGVFRKRTSHLLLQQVCRPIWSISDK